METACSRTARRPRPYLPEMTHPASPAKRLSQQPISGEPGICHLIFTLGNLRFFLIRPKAARRAPQRRCNFFLSEVDFSYCNLNAICTNYMIMVENLDMEENWFLF